MDIFIFVN